MYRKVDTWVDLNELDHRILKFWKDNQSFEKLREIIRDKPPWSFLDGPITANNPMGVHHAWGRTLKDIYQRYWAMNGRDLRYQNGFDCQGLWVEVEVEKELSFKSKKDIEAYGIDKFVEKCKERVKKFSDIQSQQSIRLGYWMDWNNSYYTMSDENNYTIWTFLKKCHDRGFVYKGNDIMPWCPRCGTGISQHEMHEGYLEVSHPSVILKFPLRGRDREALLVWTTTPWTLSSNVAAAVNPDEQYVKVKQEDWTYYMIAALADKVLSLKGPYETVSTLKGEELVGLSYDGPYDELPAQQATRLEHKVIPWAEVSSEEGTGIVHIAPGCGKEDMELGREFDLDSIAPLDEGGIFIEGFGWLTGKSASDVAEEVFADLKKKGVLFATEEYMHSYPHCWRCGTALLFRQVDEWFIAMDDWREEIMEVAKQARWIPPFGKDLELDWLRNMRDWMISKKRYWGLALPIWECESCKSFQVIGSLEELKAKATAGWEEFEGHSPHRPWIDAVKIACDKCGATAHRIEDVGNPWLDAGIVTYSTVNYNADREYWKKWIPADLVLECFTGQFRNWFYSLLAMSTMMENTPPFKTLVGHALVNDEKGEEMHKSKGNAISFDEAVEEMGCDVMRWIFCHQEISKNLNFGYSIAREMRGKFFNTLWNTYAFFTNYARLAQWVPPEKPTPLSERSDFDRWILSNLQILVKRSRRDYENYNVRGMVLAAEKFVEELSNWYVRHNRRRFWKVGNEADSSIAFETLYECLDNLIRILAPVVPFATEEIYQNLTRSHDKNAPESVHHTSFPEIDESSIDEALSEEMAAVMRINWLGLSAREKSRIKVRQPLKKLTISPGNKVQKRAAENFSKILKDFLNVKSIEVAETNTPAPVAISIRPNFAVLGKKLGSKIPALKKYIETNGEKVAKLVKAEMPVELELNGENVSIDYNDFILEESAPEDIAFAADEGIWVAYETALDDDLKLEGLMRDLLRRLQVVRKDVGLEIEDHIEISWTSDDPRIAEIFSRWGEFLDAELLCDTRREGITGEPNSEVNLDDVAVAFKIEKSTN
jgi:isoleucyl-tRNA synthetase